VYAERINIGVTEWRGYTNADGTGKYHEILSHVFAEQELNFKYSSYQRKLYFFEKEKYDAIVGVFLEDFNQGIVPYWHLDYEYPLLAFFKKDSSKISSRQHLNGAMLTWLRGYQYSKYIDVPHQAYPVETVRQGFELLMNDRTDALIDYQYNLYDEYKDKVSTFEILPPRKTYIIFSETEKGRRLAALFDKRMNELRDSGMLKAIYREEYSRTLLDKVDASKPKIQLRTRDVDLLRGESSLLDSSLESSIFSMLLESLTKYEFDLVKYNSFADDWKSFGHSLNTCIANKVKTKERADKFYFSDPVVMYPGLRLYSTRPLPGVSGRVNIKWLLSQNPRLTIGIPKGQFFSEQLNNELASISSRQKIDVSTDIITHLQAFSKQRFDMKIEFPVVMENRWHYVSDKPLFSYSLIGAYPYTLGYLMCSKSEGNKQFLADFNRSLAELKQQDVYREHHRHSAKSLSDNKFNLLFEHAFNL